MGDVQSMDDAAVRQHIIRLVAEIEMRAKWEGLRCGCVCVCVGVCVGVGVGVGAGIDVRTRWEWEGLRCVGVGVGVVSEMRTKSEIGLAQRAEVWLLKLLSSCSS